MPWVKGDSAILITLTYKMCAFNSIVHRLGFGINFKINMVQGC